MYNGTSSEMDRRGWIWGLYTGQWTGNFLSFLNLLEQDSSKDHRNGKLRHIYG